MSTMKDARSARVVKLQGDSGQDADVAEIGEAAEARKTEPAPEMRSEETQKVEAPAAAPKKGGLKGKVLPVLLVALLAGGGWFGYDWWTYGRFMISTDDAYISGDIAVISPKVTGYVKDVNVKANQLVKAGEPLITLDDGDYAIAAKQAAAQIATQELSLKRFDAQIKGAEASLEQAKAQKLSLEAALENAQQNADRATKLQAQSFASQATLDSASTTLDQAKANMVGADANIAAAQANIVVLRAQRDEAASSLASLNLAKDKAERDLGFTVLVAPYDGIIGNMAVQKGDLVSPGARLASLVPVKDLYIEANFKETQIEGLQPGEKVNITVDAFEDRPLVGTVASVAPASGSVFSMLPAENATGNFTKVVQRVPVRIAIPQEALDEGYLRAGLSVVVDVDSRTAPEKDAGK
jgi:membrane fusion protein, multidrug efflux system